MVNHTIIFRPKVIWKHTNVYSHSHICIYFVCVRRDKREKCQLSIYIESYTKYQMHTVKSPTLNGSDMHKLHTQRSCYIINFGVHCTLNTETLVSFSDFHANGFPISNRFLFCWYLPGTSHMYVKVFCASLRFFNLFVTIKEL